MLENEITKEDIGCWYLVKDGAYFKVEEFHDNVTFYKVTGTDICSDGFSVKSTYTTDGRYDRLEEEESYNLVRKLDPIEVNLLRLEQRLKDAGK